MKTNKTLLIPVVVIVISLGIFLPKLISNNVGSGGLNTTVANNTATIKLSSSPEGIYSPQVIKVKTGSRVRIEGDPTTLVGGMDTVIIDGYSVSKKMSRDNNILEFVADKAGQYKVHCANGQGNGLLVVE